MSAPDDSAHQQQVFKLIEFLTKRLDHTLAQSETSTRHIYLVNGAILAAVYFAFGRDWPLSVRIPPESVPLARDSGGSEQPCITVIPIQPSTKTTASASATS